MTLIEQEEKLLKDIQFNTDTGFIGRLALYKKAKAQLPSITHAKVKEFSERNSLSQVFRPTKKPKKKDLPSIVAKIGHYQCDLTFYRKKKRENQNHYIILTCINIHSKKGYALPLKEKNQSVVLDALKSIVRLIEEDGDAIETLQSDNETEFKNREMKAYLQSKGISQRFCQAGDKSCLGVAESFNLTLRRKIEQYLAFHKTA